MKTKPKRKARKDPEQAQDYPKQLPAAYEIWVLLNQLTEGMIKASDKELRACGISTIQHSVLWVVSTASAPPTASDLARRIQRRPSSVYALLDRMEKQGFVKVVRTSRGKPEVRVVLTREGKETFEKAKSIQQTIPRIMEALSAEELSQFEANLRTLRARTYSELSDEPLFP